MRILLLYLLFVSCSFVLCQQSNCSNIGFESISTGADQVLVPGWQLWTGRNNIAGSFTIENPETYSSTDCSANFTSHDNNTHCGIGGTGVKVYNNYYQHHDILGATTNSLNDLIDIPTLPNLSGSNSKCIRLGGQQQAGMQASGMSTTFTVDPANPFLAYHYILRFENTNHTEDNRGFAFLRMYDDQGGAIDCGSFESYENSPNENWSYDNGWDTWYMADWRTWIVDLSGFAGQNLTIEVWVADCQEGAHGGWGYFDFECLSSAQPDCSTSSCSTPTELNVPSNSYFVCENEAVSIENITFGGSASSVIISHDGFGDLSETNFNTTPFTVHYTPAPQDAGNIVTLTVLTNATINGCPEKMEEIQINVSALIEPTFDLIGPLCLNSSPPSLPLMSNEGVNGMWDNPIETTTIGSFDYFFMPDAGQCATSSVLNVSVELCCDLMADLNAVVDETCSSLGEIIMNVSGGDGDYQISIDGGATFVSGNTIEVASGSYEVIVQDGAGCEVIVNNVVVDQQDGFNILNVNVTNPSCYNNDGTVEILTDGNGQYPLVFIITPGTSSNGVYNSDYTFNQLSEGSYMIRVEDANNCVENIVVDLLIPEPPTFELNIELSDCSANNGWIEVVNINGNGPYEYFLNGIQGGPMFQNLEAGSYIVEVIDDNNCSSDSIIWVDENNGGLNAMFDVTPNSGIEPLEVTFINQSSGTIVNNIWSINGVNMVNNNSTFEYVFEEGIYNVVLTIDNGSGCADTAIHTIIVEGAFNIEIPNIFTPNDDGINDLFFIKSNGVQSVNCSVYNRWGNIIVSFDGMQKGWNGKNSQGVIMEDGVYFYVIDVVNNSGEKLFYSGNVTLVKL